MSEIYSTSILNYAAIYGQSAEVASEILKPNNADVYKDAILELR
jgi:hypothetical protein